MPVYCYICPSCGCKTELYGRMNGSNGSHKCTECGNDMVRDYIGESPVLIYEENDSLEVNLDHQPLVYHSRRQLKEMARERGCRLMD